MNAGFLGIFAALGWGSADFAARFSGRAIGPLNALLGMLIFGSILLSAWVWVSEPTLIWDSSKYWLLALSGVATMIATLLVYKAISIGPISVAAPILASYPVLVMLYSMVNGTYPTIIQGFAIVIVMVGVLLVARAEADTPMPGETRATSPSVVKVALLGSFCLSIAIVSGQASAAAFGDLQAAWLGRLVSLASILILFLLPGNKIQLPIKWWPIVAAQGILDSLAFLATFAGGNTDNPEITAVIGSSFGCVTVFLAWIFLKERISLPQWAGIIMVIAGSASLSVH